MKSKIALKLLADQLDWSDKELASEFPALQLMVNHKYDSYQGFQPASRFHVALLNWLNQFKTTKQKRIAFSFIKTYLIFITQREMHHLVSLMMPTIDRLMRERICSLLELQLYETWTDDVAQKRLDLMRRKTLFVGLSDGARIDVFRRYNEGIISNEQVVPFSEISDDKWEDLRKNLASWLQENGHTEESIEFEAVCLVDDFAGSGSSLLRQDGEGHWGGKINKFYKANFERVGSLLSKNCTIYAHHHLASEKARQLISESLVQFKIDHPNFDYVPTFSYILPQEIVIHENTEPSEIADLFKDFYNKNIEDKHTGENIWFGYKQCGLPLVLDHNTPNNSVALLWATSPEQVGATQGGHQMKPLFARRKRHSSHG